MKTPAIDWSQGPDTAVLGGSEGFFKDAIVSSARTTLSDHDYTLVWSGIDSDSVLRNHLYEGSLIPTQKLIVVRDANKADKDLLKSYCENPNRDNVVVLIASDGRKAKWFKDLKTDVRVECTSPKPWEYKDWLVAYCHSQGFNLDEGYAESIHANVGDDLYALSNEMEKVFLLMGERKTIGPKDITSVLVQHQAISPFNALKAWSMKDFAGALRMASIYFKQAQDPYASLPMVSILLGQIEKLILFDSYTKADYTKKEMCEAMGISHYIYKELHRYSVQWRRTELRKAYRHTCEVEARIKRGGNGPLLIYWLLSQDFEE